MPAFFLETIEFGISGLAVEGIGLTIARSARKE